MKPTMKGLKSLLLPYDIEWRGSTDNNRNGYSVKLKEPDINQCRKLANELQLFLSDRGFTMRASKAHTKDHEQFGLASIHKAQRVTVNLIRYNTYVGILSERTDADYNSACVMSFLGIDEHSVMSQMLDYAKQQHLEDKAAILSFAGWSEESMNQWLSINLNRFRFNIQKLA